MREFQPVLIWFLLIAVTILHAGCRSMNVSQSNKERGSAERRLTVLYFDGCPNTPPVIAAAQQAAALLGSEWSVHTVDLEALPEDDLRRGYGSPTVLLESKDLFGAPTPTTPTLSCRHYAQGLPDADAIVAAVRSFEKP
ncbi:MAG: hypothetical protein D6695_03450 [Planctomycetota bacterium]|nr:MAG: hypothetical protein D6695_03450 [Planctomycetota bacterium]